MNPCVNDNLVSHIGHMNCLTGLLEVRWYMVDLVDYINAECGLLLHLLPSSPNQSRSYSRSSGRAIFRHLTNRND